MIELDGVFQRLFSNAERIMDELSAENGKFNSQAFIRRVMQDQPKAYIELLAYHKEARYPFKEAHQGIGQQLKQRALAHGFAEVGLVDEETLFRTPTRVALYRR